MGTLVEQLQAAIAAYVAPELQPAFEAALCAAERATADISALDAVVEASMALWDVPTGPAGARILESINHFAFGGEEQAVAVLAALANGEGI